MKGSSDRNNPFEQDNNDSPGPERLSYLDGRSPERRLRRNNDWQGRSPVTEQDTQFSHADSFGRRRPHRAPPVDAYSQSKLADNDGERQIDGIKNQIRTVKQDTVQSTRNAVQTIQASQDTARNTLSQLGEQASQIANVDRQLGEAKAQAEQAAQKTTRLKQLNRSIFIPALKNPFQRKARARQELEEAKREHAEACDDRDAINRFEYQSKNRTDYAQRPKQGQFVSSSGRTEPARNQYQFEPDQEDDAIEDEIDQNLEMVGHSVGNLKEMAVAMQDEIRGQNDELERISDKADPINEKLFVTTHKINKIK